MRDLKIVGCEDGCRSDRSLFGVIRILPYWSEGKSNAMRRRFIGLLRVIRVGFAMPPYVRSSPQQQTFSYLVAERGIAPACRSRRAPSGGSSRQLCGEDRRQFALLTGQGNGPIGGQPIKVSRMSAR